MHGTERVKMNDDCHPSITMIGFENDSSVKIKIKSTPTRSFQAYLHYFIYFSDAMEAFIKLLEVPQINLKSISAKLYFSQAVGPVEVKRLKNK